MHSKFAYVRKLLYLCSGFQNDPSKSIQVTNPKASKLRKEGDMNVRHNKIEALLQCIGDETKTRRQIQGDMHLNNRRNFRLHYLNPAMEMGYVRFLYVETPNKPEQAYFVTEKGMKHLKEFEAQNQQEG